MNHKKVFLEEQRAEVLFETYVLRNFTSKTYKRCMNLSMIRLKKKQNNLYYTK